MHGGQRCVANPVFPLRRPACEHATQLSMSIAFGRALGSRTWLCSRLIARTMSAAAPTQAPAHEFLRFVDASPSPFHAVHTVSEMLRAAGFEQLHERDAWGSLRPNGKYFVTRNQSALVRWPCARKICAADPWCGCPGGVLRGRPLRARQRLFHCGGAHGQPVPEDQAHLQDRGLRLPVGRGGDVRWRAVAHVVRPRPGHRGAG